MKKMMTVKAEAYNSVNQQESDYQVRVKRASEWARRSLRRPVPLIY